MTAWADAVTRFTKLPLEGREIVSKKFSARTRDAANQEWRNTALLNRLIDGLLGLSPGHLLDSAADEYDEAMKAIEIYDALQA